MFLQVLHNVKQMLKTDVYPIYMQTQVYKKKIKMKFLLKTNIIPNSLCKSEYLLLQ